MANGVSGVTTRLAQSRAETEPKRDFVHVTIPHLRTADRTAPDLTQMLAVVKIENARVRLFARLSKYTFCENFTYNTMYMF